MKDKLIGLATVSQSTEIKKIEKFKISLTPRSVAAFHKARLGTFLRNDAHLFCIHQVSL